MAYDEEDLRAAYALPDRSTPRIRFNFVSSLDGAATLRGTAGGLGDPLDQRLMGILRSMCDVVLVGAGTVRAEGYVGALVGEADTAWRLDHGLSAHPAVAIVSGNLNLDPTSDFFGSAPVRPIIVTTANAPAEKRAAFVDAADVIDGGEDSLDAERVMRVLAGLGLPQVLCEGGPRLFGTFVSAGRVDELCLSLGPHLVAGDAFRITRGAPEVDLPMNLLHAIPADDLVLLRYRQAH